MTSLSISENATFSLHYLENVPYHWLITSYYVIVPFDHIFGREIHLHTPWTIHLYGNLSGNGIQQISAGNSKERKFFQFFLCSPFSSWSILLCDKNRSYSYTCNGCRESSLNFPKFTHTKPLKCSPMSVFMFGEGSMKDRERYVCWCE